MHGHGEWLFVEHVGDQPLFLIPLNVKEVPNLYSVVFGTRRQELLRNSSREAVDFLVMKAR